jgi:hypothetical protein
MYPTVWHWFSFERETKYEDLDEYPFQIIKMVSSGSWTPPVHDPGSVEPKQQDPLQIAANEHLVSFHVGSTMEFVRIMASPSGAITFSRVPAILNMETTATTGWAFTSPSLGCIGYLVRDSSIISRFYTVAVHRNPSNGVLSFGPLVQQTHAGSAFVAQMNTIIPMAPSFAIVGIYTRPTSTGGFHQTYGWTLVWNGTQWITNNLYKTNEAGTSYDTETAVRLSNESTRVDVSSNFIGTNEVPYSIYQGNNFLFGSASWAVLSAVRINPINLRPYRQWTTSQFMNTFNGPSVRSLFPLTVPGQQGVSGQRYGGIPNKFVGFHDGTHQRASDGAIIGGGVRAGLVLLPDQMTLATWNEQAINGTLFGSQNHNSDDTATDVYRPTSAAALDSKYFAAAWAHSGRGTLTVQIMRIMAPEPALRFGQRDDDILTEDGDSFTAARLRSGSVPRTKNKPGTGNPTSAQRSPRIAGAGNTYW